MIKDYYRTSWERYMADLPRVNDLRKSTKKYLWDAAAPLSGPRCFTLRVFYRGPIRRRPRRQNAETVR